MWPILIISTLFFFSSASAQSVLFAQGITQDDILEASVDTIVFVSEDGMMIARLPLMAISSQKNGKRELVLVWNDESLARFIIYAQSSTSKVDHDDRVFREESVTPDMHKAIEQLKKNIQEPRK